MSRLRPITFWVFLKRQRTRNDAIGTFARSVAADLHFTAQPMELDRLTAYLTAQGASPETLTALGTAWRYWQARQGVVS